MSTLRALKRVGPLRRVAHSTLPALSVVPSAHMHFFPGGPQNASERRNILGPLKQLIVRIKRVGVWQTIQDFNQMSEINFGETSGTLRGVDEFGNRYYENLDNQFLRHRWVEYAEKRREMSHGATVPPGWFGWIHHSKSFTPADAEYKKPPKWVLLHKENFTATDKRYMPSNYGALFAPPKYQSWRPKRALPPTDSHSIEH